MQNFNLPVRALLRKIKTGQYGSRKSNLKKVFISVRHVTSGRCCDLLVARVAISSIKSVVLEWKRALKNYKNIVTIFVDEESSFKAEANRWMGPGARKSHKSAKMFYINCAEKEGKKLCKKYKQNPKPTTMQYWREGLFYKEFHREETPKAGFIRYKLYLLLAGC